MVRRDLWTLAMKLQKLASTIDYHERVAEAAADPVLAITHAEAARLLRGIYEPAALAHTQRQHLMEKRRASSNLNHIR